VRVRRTAIRDAPSRNIYECAYIFVMTFTRIKTIKGKQYLYRQTSVRKGKKVRSFMEYLGRVTSGLASAESRQEKDRREYQEYYDRSMRSLARDEAKFEEWQRKTYGETGEERSQRETKESRFSQEVFLNETAKPLEDS
jgi:hypothetical protein